MEQHRKLVGGNVVLVKITALLILTVGSDPVMHLTHRLQANVFPGNPQQPEVICWSVLSFSQIYLTYCCIKAIFHQHQLGVFTWISHVFWSNKTICHVTKDNHHNGESCSMEYCHGSTQHHEEFVPPVRVSKLKVEKELCYKLL